MNDARCYVFKNSYDNQYYKLFIAKEGGDLAEMPSDFGFHFDGTIYLNKPKTEELQRLYLQNEEMYVFASLSTSGDTTYYEKFKNVGMKVIPFYAFGAAGANDYFDFGNNHIMTFPTGSLNVAEFFINNVSLGRVEWLPHASTFSNNILALYTDTGYISDMTKFGIYNKYNYYGHSWGPTSYELRAYNDAETVYKTPSTSETDINILKAFFADLPLVPPSEQDPYYRGGESETAGGGGDFDGSSDAIGVPSAPLLNATDAGFVTLFNPSLAQLQQVSSYLWGPLFDISSLKKMFSDPMDCILGLQAFPFAIPHGSTDKELKVGNIGTGINLHVPTSQYVDIDCGSVNLNEYWGNYLDYSPYTTLEIYLPYIGTVPIDIDDVMGKTISVLYRVDILNGSGVCFVSAGGSVLYNYSGNFSENIPFTSLNYTNTIIGIAKGLDVAAGAIVGGVTGGASGAMASAQGGIGGLSGLASTVASSKPTILRGGSIESSHGIIGIQYPYLILTRPKQQVAAGQNALTGYPSYISKRLGDLTGFTQIESIHLENIPATNDEKRDIEQRLKTGVIL